MKRATHAKAAKKIAAIINFGMYENGDGTHKVMCEVGKQPAGCGLKLVHEFQAPSFEHALCYADGYDTAKAEFSWPEPEPEF